MKWNGRTTPTLVIRTSSWIELRSRFSGFDFELPFFLLINGRSSRCPLLNKGCLNSRQFGSTNQYYRQIQTLSCLMKAIHVQLSDKRREVAMFKIQREDLLWEIINLSYYILHCQCNPTFKIRIDSPFSPQHTMSLNSSLCMMAYVLLKNAGITWLFRISSSSSKPSAYYNTKYSYC